MRGKFRKKEKIILVFDEKDRRDFLTGFRKRKNERRKVAQEENKKKEENKRKQLRGEKREALRHHIQEYENQVTNKTEMDENLSKQPESITHDFGQHTVTVSTITDEDMGKDFLNCAYPTQNQSRTITDNKITIDTHKQTARGKSLRQRQFHKKAQKRKIQAASDKKTLKQKLKQKGKRR